MEKISELLISQTIHWGPKITSVILIVVIFYILAKIIKGIIVRTSKRLELESNISMLIARVAKIAVILFGIVTALGTLGIDVTAIVAGLGLTGFAVGFALKDTIANIISGVMILLYRPFITGDRIEIAGYKGDVVAIDLRYTELVTDSEKILIPNAKLFTDPIIVFNKQ
ncbi:MAG: mechanosensitive ion channel [Gammaproteobacteria bacterium]|nr:mechanosensitive ion channel [Gammaproteobacteria bacterium]